MHEERMVRPHRAALVARTLVDARIEPKCEGRRCGVGANAHAIRSSACARLWTLQAIGACSDEIATQALTDTDDYVRGWTVQLLTDDARSRPLCLRSSFVSPRHDPSPVVRLYLASAIQRVPEEAAWELIDALAQHA